MRHDYYDDGKRPLNGGRIWHVVLPAKPFSTPEDHQDQTITELPAIQAAPVRHRKRWPWLPLVVMTSSILLVMVLALSLDFKLPEEAANPEGGTDQEAEETFPLFTATELKRAPTGDGTTLEICREPGESLSAREIYRRVSPSVVVIKLLAEDGMYLGTGVIMSEDGYIITNAHVVENGIHADVLFPDGTEREAMLVGEDAQTDLAVLKVEASGLPVATFGDSSMLQVGDSVYAIGTPLKEELQNTMTDGIISALERPMVISGAETYLLQTTAAINPGNSGGALVDTSGRVIGITNMKMVSFRNTIEGLGFAIPSAQAKTVVDQLIAFGHCVERPVLGVVVSDQELDGDRPAGARVMQVRDNSDAYQQGVRSGDVIIRANDTVVTSVRDLKRAQEGLKAGDVMELELWHKGKGTRTVQVTLMEQYDLEENP